MADAPTIPSPSLVSPLDEFYALAGQPLPPWQQVDGADIPEPHRALLVHDVDMTSTLEKFHGGPIHLRVLGRRRNGGDYSREVVLQLNGTNRPVEFGAIKIYIDRFPEAARKEILEEYYPLGHILHEHGIQFSSHPKAFLKLAADKLIAEVLGFSGAHILYGRRNTLFDPDGQTLAEIVEILPPA